MSALVSLWGHAAAALVFAFLAASEARRPDAGRWALACASGATVLWGVAAASAGPASIAASLAETLRNAAWLGFMYLLLRRGAGRRRGRAVAAIYGALALVVAAEIAVAFAPASVDLLRVYFLLRMIFAVGALVLVHNLYAATASGARRGAGLAMAALAAIWAYDLNLYTLSWIAHGWVGDLTVGRGGLTALTAPVFALAARRDGAWTLRLSRTVAFRSLGLVAALAYFIATIGVTAVLDAAGAARIQLAFLIAAAVGAAVLLPNRRARAWARVMLAKHVFAHRYDYRAEWLRFTDTLGRPGDAPAGLDVRVVKAVADITESPSGLLLLPDGTGVSPDAVWNRAPALHAPDARLAALLATGRIVELDALRRDDSVEAASVPEWILSDPVAWAIVPLIHFDRLAGAVLLDRPVIDRTLDWEDFDLLRVAGRQVASYLAEAQGQEALSEAQRFDEFNRRFAFIMHDIKNLASQLTLVTRNAQRHIEKPEFRADMIATLESSTARMNDLLARLSQHNKARPEIPRACPVGPLAAQVAAARRAQHPVVVSGNAALFAVADPVRLETALTHLVQNAIDASGPAEPVTIALSSEDGEAAITVIDQGAGMTADFVRAELFRPFASTKAGGFGIGAHEARALVVAMGGRLEVESEPSKGSRFTIRLPAATGWMEADAA